LFLGLGGLLLLLLVVVVLFLLLLSVPDSLKVNICVRVTGDTAAHFDFMGFFTP
jgi:competence protein ComGC